MNSNIKIILIATLTGLAGLTAGYFLFKGDGQTTDPHHHSAETAGDEIWTCSMHPQIRQNEPGDCPICGMDLIPLSSTNTSSNPLVMEMTPEAVKLAQIRTESVAMKTSGRAKTLSLTGKVRADERTAASQVAHVPGRIEKLYVTFTGEQIRQGQPLAAIYSPELISAQKELLEAKKWAERQPRLLEAAREKLRYWKIPEAAIQRVEETGQIQQTVDVFADQGGVVLQRRVSVGDYVREGAVLFDLANLNRLWLLFDAYEEDLAHVRVGDAVQYTVPAVPGRTFRARISYIDPVINPKTRTATLRAEVENPQGLLKPEMFIRGTIQAGGVQANARVSVPKTAVMWTGERSVVYLEVPDATVPSYEFREVTLGEALGDRYLIEEGLDPGDRVVVNGAFVIDAAAQLNNMASMMNRQVQTSGEEPAVPDFTQQTPTAFQAQLKAVVGDYLNLKDALVLAEPVKARQTAEGLLDKLKQVDMTLLEGDAHVYWMEQANALKSHGNRIGAGEDLDEQRRQFSFLSQALIHTLEAFGTADTLYVQHCPMAFDDAGADWVSSEEAIRNPYFGDQMLKCGVVKEVFPVRE